MPDELFAAKAMLHYWEEPVISAAYGAGTVFFSGCTLGCLYCQNDEISHQNFGKLLSPAALRVARQNVGSQRLSTAHRTSNSSRRRISCRPFSRP